MILESIVTTVNQAGEINIAPMGPIVLPASENTDDEGTTGESILAANRQSQPLFCMRPYQGSTTCENLLSTGKAVIHVTDDVLLIARTAIGQVASQGLVCKAELDSDQHFRLKDCHRWFAVEVTEFAGTPPLHELTARTIADGIVRPFFGFNRAKHAVIETAILATRVRMLDPVVIQDSIARLRVPVEKTAGPDEQQAFDLLVEFIDGKLS